MSRWKQFWCGFWRRHEYFRQGDVGRMYQQCMLCDHQTPGFEIDALKTARLQQRME